MFDFAWSEIVLIGAVALIAIGPKDMPAAIRTVSGMIKKARRMAAEFQTHVDEMVREADLGDVKKAFSDIRNLNIAGALEKHIDPDRSIRNTFSDDPFRPTYPTSTPVRDEVTVATPDEVTIAARGEVAVAERAEISTAAGIITSGHADAEPVVPSEAAIEPTAPAFIPPSMLPPAVARPAVPPPEAPPFIPPEAVLQRHANP